MSATRPMIEPFTIDVPDAVLADRRERLAATRWPIEEDFHRSMFDSEGV